MEGQGSREEVLPGSTKWVPGAASKWGSMWGVRQKHATCANTDSDH